AAPAAPRGRAGGAWFCPGPPDPATYLADRVQLANVGSGAANVVVTVLADNGDHVQAESIAPSSLLTLRTSDLGPPGPITVETFGAQLVVEELSDGSGFDANPCATATAADWSFAAGTTPRDVDQFLVIDNPYATDAKVDVTLRTNEGVMRPDKIQNFDIFRRSRRVVPLHLPPYAVRTARVAVEVHAQAGEVVAAQWLRFRSGSGALGTTWTLGATSTSDHWTFPEVRTSTDMHAWVAIVNPSLSTANVDVVAIPDTNIAIPPTTVTVAADDVVWVQLGDCRPGTGCLSVPNGSRFSVDVHADENVGVVAQLLERGLTGVSAPLGVTAAAPAWTFATSTATGEVSTVLSFVEPLAQPAQVDIALVGGGVVTRPPALQHITVQPGHRRTVRVAGVAVPPDKDQAILVTSSVPVVVMRSIVTATETSVASGTTPG
ncbi:MAG TPA: DUF5719 family protein, partial [Acidimicrobiia bacterium]|nr:DUF5719 family protein [Acidimicrobiia bacterium]